ncbi:MAG: integrase arm-type DNA-binding domain-containing protein [Defluviicoccus sp.]|nr:integrase arm-type DNA-binding domain-containing protein [Defluviicoccus sp.]MDE0276838.1 integrase arm-type DNA-binding domain-containing protein [Defluviicoccus sp.]
MPARERRKLTDAAIVRLRPRAREYTVWDNNVSGLGVRVRPTGGKTWVLLEEIGVRTKRVSLGPVSTMAVAEARRACHERRARPVAAETPEPAPPKPLFREFVEGVWKKGHFDRYKPSTKKSVRSFLTARILPAFGSAPLDRIAAAEVRKWFDAWSRSAPGGANKGLEILRQIMNFAIARGYIEKNPAQGIRPNRRPKLTRFLSREEIARLHRALDAETGKGNRQLGLRSGE